MTVGIVGLGLIGGSAAKAYKQNGSDMVLGFDTHRPTLEYARLTGAIDGELTEERLSECDLLLIALYPEAAIEYLKENAHRIQKDALVIDFCGTKREICKTGFSLANTYGFTFVGGHPMAGRQYSGFKYADANLFRGASMVLVPEKRDDIFLLDRVKNALAPANFGRISVTTPEEHDRIIAFSSQLAHVVSNAYVKSPTAKNHAGFSAGSYKDLTRVARLNEDMWTMLFLENRTFLAEELTTLIGELTKYRDALLENDGNTLHSLLKDGRECKEAIDGK
ncbi:MAG: prephenate dehydrogenase/arogenate dehydrogenase family protein [Clostridia bacterium]|nr:prephenate dehydrogenase/arogenate dehydrogenase family protein [Clostridia bacterium]